MELVRDFKSSGGIEIFTGEANSGGNNHLITFIAVADNAPVLHCRWWRTVEGDEGNEIGIVTGHSHPISDNIWRGFLSRVGGCASHESANLNKRLFWV